MNSHFFSRRVLAAACLCIVLQAGGALSEAVAAENGKTSKPAASPAKPVAKAKPAAKAKPVKKKTASAKAKPVVPAVSETGDAVHDKLRSFAHTTMTSMNRCLLPSASKKEVTQNADGSYTCRYKEVDTKSLRTSYKTPESSKEITYVGYMTYDELEYRSSAKTRNEALAGPYSVASRHTLTELIKYVGGKWTY